MGDRGTGGERERGERETEREGGERETEREVGERETDREGQIE